MFTLTVDRKAFGAPIDAFITITEGGYIRRLMRLLKVEKWAWTLELQMKTGEGWPHWHMIINLPPCGLDLERAWRLWRDKWHLGGLDLQRKKNKNAKHAMFYVTKYLTKYPEDGFPSWILHHPKRIRWVGGTRSLGPLVSDREVIAKDAGDNEEAKESLPRVHRPLAMRMAECGKIVNFFIETECDGEVYQTFFGRMPQEQVIAATHKRSMLPVFNDEDGKAYLVGNWDSFAELASDIMEQANRPPGKCHHYWSTTQRFKDYRGAEYLTHEPDWGNDQ
ncbi:MAG: hypothetical protein ACF8OB_01580 [Phycisphaeraceae bacterium JB051]